MQSSLMRRHSTALIAAITLTLSSHSMAQLTLRPDVKIPDLPGFRVLPAPDTSFTSAVTDIVKATKLDEITPIEKSADNREERSSICIVDLRDTSHPVVADYNAGRFIYPASAYKAYVLGEAIRQVCAGERSLDDPTTVVARNVRSDSRLTTGEVVSLSEILRLMCAYSDNTAANVAIDVVDRQRASAMLRAMGLTGSDITRKYLARTLEDDGYSTVPSTESNALHFATFLYAVETGAIGGGKGRGLIKAYLSMNGKYMGAGLPPSATLFSKTGWWNTYTCEIGLVEDGATRYITCVMTPYPSEIAAGRIADFTRRLHALMIKCSEEAKKP